MKRGEMKTTLHFVFISLVIILATPVTYPKADSIYTKVTSDSVTIWHTQTERNCGSAFLINFEVDSFYIKVVEYDTSKMSANCLCNFDLSITLGSLLPGTYTAEITGVNIWRGDSANYGTTSFFVPETETGKITELQSECYFAPEKPFLNKPSEFYPGNDSLYVEVNGYTAKLWHAHLIQNCASLFAMSYEMDNNYVKVIELDTVMFRYDCICEYDVALEIGPLYPGTYIAEFIGRGVLSADSFSYGSTSFKIESPADGAVKLSQYQYSACHTSEVSEQSRESIPGEYALYPVHPNPFNPSTIISYSLPAAGVVTIKIFDMLGNEIQTLLNEVKSSGKYELEFDGTGLASGIYIYAGCMQVNISKAAKWFL